MILSVEPTLHAVEGGGRCARHGGHCTVPSGEIDIFIGGFPCTPPLGPWLWAIFSALAHAGTQKLEAILYGNVPGLQPLFADHFARTKPVTSEICNILGTILCCGRRTASRSLPTTPVT